MAGEMSQSEVTRESYPLLFALRDSLKRRGIESEPRAFDQYQGPYLRVNGLCKVWYQGEMPGPARLLIERGLLNFSTIGATWIVPAADKSVTYGVYTLRQASKRIAAIKAGKP